MERFAPTFREAADIVEVPLTEPGPGEVRVRNRYCGVNAIFDTQIARNAVDYVKIGLPTFTGVEALGVVDAVGEGVTDFAPGDAAVTVRFTGGYREANVAPAEAFAHVPEASAEWLALASTGVSALVALEQIGEIRQGETVAISAAAGGLGHLLVQIALLRGCHVIGVAGGPRKCDFVRSLGAQRVIDYKSEDVAAVLASEYPGGIDLAVDTVSGAIYDAFLANIAYHGRLVVGGAASDLNGKPEMVTAPRIAHAIYYKGASVRGFMNGLLTPHWADARARLFALYREGKLKVCLDERQFNGLEGIYDAVEHLLSGASMGKVVAEIGAA
jgi:NADPH-dependent curcumin reductase CurA